MCFRFFAIVSRFHLTIGVFFVHSSKLFIHSLSEWFFSQKVARRMENPYAARHIYFFFYRNSLKSPFLQRDAGFVESDFADILALRFILPARALYQQVI